MFRVSLSLFFLLTVTAYAQVTSSGSASSSSSGMDVSTPDALQPQEIPQAQGPPAPPQAPPVSGTAAAGGQTTSPGTAPGSKPPSTQITLEQAITLALANSPTLLATRTTVPQSQAQELTARLRPNPVLSWDALFIPIFSPGNFSENFVNNVQQFDVGIGYLIERGHKRQARLQAARDATAVTQSQVYDAERALTFNVAQQFVNALLAKSNLQFAQQDLASFQETVNISQERYKAGDISEGDLLKIKIQMLQFQTDVASAQIARAQALGSLRQLIGFQSVPRDYDVAGDLVFQPLTVGPEDLQAKALRERPDLKAAQQGVTAAGSQVALAKANGKQDLDTSFTFSHVSGASSGSVAFSIPLAIFNRNQGEIARTRFALTQAQLTEKAAEETVVTDVGNAYEATKTNQQIVELYQSGYLNQAQQSRDISDYAYKRGAATLLDLLDAERSYRSTQLAYRQSLATYMLSLEQLREAVGSRSLP
jgi:outer membrane protein, heavy metal efflux system